MKGFYATESEIEAVVRGFESCETDKTNFKHRDHLTVAVYYFQGADIQQATERMRSALFAFLDHHCVLDGIGQSGAERGSAWPFVIGELQSGH